MSERARNRENVRVKGRGRGRERENVREGVNVFERNTMRERKNEEVQPRDSEYEWKTVRSRKSRYLRTQANGGKGRRQQSSRRNWREGVDITSFYFTRFPEEVTEAELWTHFRQWGEVKEIFIPNRRNKEGRRYGFVRLKGIADTRSVERDLDNSFIRGLKLHVNIPKYGRGEAMKDQTQHKLVYKGVGMVENVCKEEASRRAAVSKTTKRSYAEVAASLIKRSNHLSKDGNHFAGDGSSWSTLSMDISEDDTVRYKNVWVSRVKKLEIFERLEEEVAWHVGPGISAKYLGDDMALLLGLSDKRAVEILREETEQASSLFYSLTKWNPKLWTENRLVWIRCWGIPVVAWKMENIRRIVAAVGDLVDVDDDVELMQRLDRARVLVRTSWPPLIQHVTVVHIDGASYRVSIVEENGGVELNGNRHGRSTWGSSEEIISDEDEDDMATLRSWSTGMLPLGGVRELADECHDTQSSLLPTGHLRVNEPVGNDPPDKMMGPTSISDTVTSPKRKQFEMVKEQQTPYPVTFDEKAVDSEKICDRLAEINKAGSSSFARVSANCPSEAEADPKLGQNVETSFDHNGPHTPLYEYSEVHNHIGPFTLNTPEAQLKEYNISHQQQPGYPNSESIPVCFLSTA